MQTCPKCHYTRTPQDDNFYSKDECPKCGVIYSKVLQKNQNSKKALDDKKIEELSKEKEIQPNPPPLPNKSPSPDEEEPPASLKVVHPAEAPEQGDQQSEEGVDNVSDSVSESSKGLRGGLVLPALGQTPKTEMSGPKGVGGWLLFFCVGLTILGPIIALGQMASGWEQTEPAFELFPTLKTAIYFENFGHSLILFYGFIIGCKIWGGDPAGKTLAKQYLRVRLFGFLGIEVITLLLFMPSLPSQMVSAAMPPFVGGVFREGVCFLVWWLYFKKSKRVKNTFVN